MIKYYLNQPSRYTPGFSNEPTGTPHPSAAQPPSPQGEGKSSHNANLTEP